jgi:transcriptional regulator NrdR family protein
VSLQGTVSRLNEPGLGRDDRGAFSRILVRMKPKVYLAGPISACNSEQRDVWRSDLKRGFSEEFEFIDPTDKLIADDGSDFEVVQADAEAIRQADAVLANMWRESIGTSFGILHAHMAGKIVVVCDPNLIRSRMLAFYADAVERNLPAALNSIRTFLRSERLILAVRKRSGDEEPFDRQKLSSAVRRACLAAGTGDVVPTRAIVARTLALLMEDAVTERVLTSEEIVESVWQAMAELAADPVHEVDYDCIRKAWESHATQATRVDAPAAPTPELPVPIIHEKPLPIPVRSTGTHRTMWGRGHKVSDGAARIFDEIRRVDGIMDISFGPFSNTHSPPAKPHVRLQAAKEAHLIEGKCYDLGAFGTLQTFRIRVANPAARDMILGVLREHLVRAGHIRSNVYSPDS